MTDIQTIIQSMTLQEKAALCTGASAWTTTPVERLGLPALRVADGPHGVRRVSDSIIPTAPSLPATCFPTASCLAASWDPVLLRAVGQALGEECSALGVDVLLGPGVNMKRTPLCGRNFEYFAEDPFLAGQMAASLVNGVQDMGVGTSLKHFAANNQEYRRMSIDARVDERTLREIYLPAFEAVVKQAKPWSVMCAYNQLNGIYCSEQHQLLVDILKKEWGFEGLVVSDWGAVHDRVAALQGGLDLEMPGPQPSRVAAVVAAVNSGELCEAELDESVRRILGAVFKAAARPQSNEFDSLAHHQLARRAAAEGMVLLQNNGVLPIKPGQRLAVIGRAAKQPHFQGGGSSHVNPTQVDIPLDELQKQAGGGRLDYAEGYPADDTFQQGLIDEAVQLALAAQVALIFVALPDADDNEGNDRTSIDLPAQQVALIKAVAAVQPQTVVIINSGSAVAMTGWISGVAAVVMAWLMGQAGGGAIADVLFGRVNPSGKLAETIPPRLVDTPAYLNFPGDPTEVRYGENLFIGYRYYDARQMLVLFPFGHGLSYTSFAYAEPHVSASTFKDVDGLTVSVAVTNTGASAGQEVVQIYVHDQKSKLVRPPKELKGFAKVALQPGETKTVSIPLDFRSFAYYHPAYHQWITENGDFDILIGASATDIRCRHTVVLQSTLQLPVLLDRGSSLADWLAEPRGRVIIQPLFQQIKAQLAHAGGSGSAATDGGITAASMLGFLLETPLLSVLEFQAQMAPLPMPAVNLVDGLLAQVRGSNGRHN